MPFDAPPADYHEKDDLSGLKRIRSLIGNLNIKKYNAYKMIEPKNPRFSSDELMGIFHPENPGQYDMIEIIARIVDESKFSELSEIWLAYTYLRMNMADQASEKIKMIQSKKSFLQRRFSSSIDHSLIDGEKLIEKIYEKSLWSRYGL